MPETPDVVPGTIILADQDNEIRDRTLQRYVDATRRATDAASPGDGEQSILTASFEYAIWTGTEWLKYPERDGPYAAIKQSLAVLEDYEAISNFGASWSNFPYGGFELLRLTLPAQGTYEIWGGCSIEVDIPIVTTAGHAYTSLYAVGGSDYHARTAWKYEEGESGVHWANLPFHVVVDTTELASLTLQLSLWRAASVGIVGQYAYPYLIARRIT